MYTSRFNNIFINPARNRFLIWSFRGLFIPTSRGCSTEVQPPGIIDTLVSKSSSILLVRAASCEEQSYPRPSNNSFVGLD